MGPLQFDMWPLEYSEEDKTETIRIVKEALENAPHSLTSGQVYSRVFSKLLSVISFKHVSVKQRRIAIDRALRELAFQVWVLKPEHLER